MPAQRINAAQGRGYSALKKNLKIFAAEASTFDPISEGERNTYKP
jgi:hypothetical protein